jgi:hypothetical protein
MMQGLKFHRNSAIKSLVNYSLMTTTGLLGTPGKFQEAIQATVSLMHDSNYQHISVSGVSRPVLFIYYSDPDLERIFNGSLQSMREPIDYIRQLSTEQGLGNPYIVILLSGADKAESVRLSLGADAISEYVSGTRKGGVQPWTDFEKSIEVEWDSYAAKTSGHVIPTLRSGADIRARCQTPPPFEHRFPNGFECESFYVKNPTLSELKAEFRSALSWIKSNPNKNPANLVLIYSWSECDESGNCLMPTIGDPKGDKIKAISEILR